LSSSGKIKAGALFNHNYLIMTGSTPNLLTGTMDYWKLNEANGTRFNSVTAINLFDTTNSVISGIGVINNGAVFNHNWLQT